MKNAFSLLFGLLLVACLTLYGPYGMAKVRGDSDVFTMEICVDGVAKTVLAGNNGQPVEPTQRCPDCLTCCSAIVSHPKISCAVAQSFALEKIEPDRPSFLSPIVKNRNVLPVPRGPPVVHLSLRGSPDLIGRDHAINDFNKRHGGRPLFKDVNA
jgi:hypothetical protein